MTPNEMGEMVENGWNEIWSKLLSCGTGRLVVWYIGSDVPEVPAVVTCLPLFTASHLRSYVLLTVHPGMTLGK